MLENVERLDRIISDYCGADDVLYNEIAEELSKYFHRMGTDIEMLPGELSDGALACLTRLEEYQPTQVEFAFKGKETNA